MRIRGIGELPQKGHIRAIKHFATFLGHSPDTATPDELRNYQLHMTDDEVSAATFNTRIVSQTPRRTNWHNERSAHLGSALTHHPHIHMIVPGGGMSPDGSRWIGCKPGFFLHARVLSRLFRRLFLEGLLALHRAGKLVFFGDLAGLSEPQAFAAYLAPLRKTEWVVYAKLPFGGPEAVLAYLSRYRLYHPYP